MNCVVDTNVPIVTNNAAPQASGDCVVTCANALRRFEHGENRLVLDSSWLILREYMDNLLSSGQPGLGDAFLRWVLVNRANDQRCLWVNITPTHNGQGFAEFPDDAELATFDPSDRKFVATAISCERILGSKPPILTAVDTDWWASREALQRSGLVIQFLCQADIQRLADRE